MRFKKTINLWEHGIQDKILSGEIKLQPGQWVLCGSDKPSRFCGVTKTGTFVCTHRGASGTVENESFKCHLDYWRGRK